MASATKIMMIPESTNIPKVYFSDPTVLKTGFSRILGTVVILIDYGIRMAVGAIGGWVIGYCLGHIFLDMFEPARLESIEAIKYWYYLPLSFGHCGALIAAGISVPVAYLLSKRRRDRQISECYMDEMSSIYDFNKEAKETLVQLEKVKPDSIPCKVG